MQKRTVRILLLQTLAASFLACQFFCISPFAIESNAHAATVSQLAAKAVLHNKNITSTQNSVNDPIIFVHGISQDARLMGLPQKDPSQDAFVPLYTALKAYSVQTFWYLDDKGYVDGLDKKSHCPQQYAACLSQSSVIDNAAHLDQMISNLYTSYHHKVTLIGYSMGAAIIRTALAGCPQNLHCQANLDASIATLVDNVFFIAGVQQGSWVAQDVTNAQTNIDAGISFLAPYQPDLEARWGLTKKVATDLMPQSSNVLLHNSKLPPSHIHYFNFYGDIQFSWENCLFLYCVAGKSAPIGDGIILPGSDDPKATPLNGGARFCLGCNGNNFSQIDADTNYTQWPLSGNVAIDKTGLDNCTDLGCVVAELSPLFGAPQLHMNLPSDASLDGTAIQVQDLTHMSGSKTTSVANEIALQLEAQQNIYVSSRDGNIYALNARTGKQLWIYPTGSQVPTNTQVVDGLVYFILDIYVDGGPPGTSTMYVLNAENGVLVHQYKLPFFTLETGPFIPSFTVANRNIYFSSPTTVFAMNGSTGIQLWQHAWQGRGASAPIIVHNLLYYVSIGVIYAFNLSNGALVWRYDLGPDAMAPGSIMGTYPSPIIIDDAMYVVGWLTDNVYAINLHTHNLQWHIHIPNVQAGALSAANGTLYVGAFSPQSLFALRMADGMQLWSKQNVSLETVTSDRLYCIGSDSNGSTIPSLSAFLPDGTFSWNDNLESISITVIPDIVYVSTPTFLYALYVDTGDVFWQTPIVGQYVVAE